jgi:hypothetical protein
MRLGFTIAAAAPVAAATGPAAPFVLAAAAITSILPFAANWFRKDPDKVEYDAIREDFWQAYIHVHDSVEPHIEILTRDQMAQAVAVIEKMLHDFKAATDQHVASHPEDRDWIMPRYRDVYDPMFDLWERWIEVYRQKPVPAPPSVFDSFGNLFTGEGAESWLGPALLVGAVLLFARR